MEDLVKGLLSGFCLWQESKGLLKNGTEKMESEIEDFFTENKEGLEIWVDKEPLIIDYVYKWIKEVRSIETNNSDDFEAKQYRYRTLARFVSLITHRYLEKKKEKR